MNKEILKELELDETILENRNEQGHHWESRQRQIVKDVKDFISQHFLSRKELEEWIEKNQFAIKHNGVVDLDISPCVKAEALLSFITNKK